MSKRRQWIGMLALGTGLLLGGCNERDEVQRIPSDWRPVHARSLEKTLEYAWRQGDAHDLRVKIDVNADRHIDRFAVWQGQKGQRYAVVACVSAPPLPCGRRVIVDGPARDVPRLGIRSVRKTDVLASPAFARLSRSDQQRLRNYPGDQMLRVFLFGGSDSIVIPEGNEHWTRVYLKS